MSDRKNRDGKQKENPIVQLAESFARWDFLCENGGSDPSWSDGVNLNLVANHIDYYKKKIEEEYPDGGYPEIYYRPTPEKVDGDYMAKPDEIRAAARKSLKTYKANENYRYILSHISLLDSKEQKCFSLLNVASYVSHLEDCIRKDDLIYQRLHLDADRYLESFKRCADQMRELLSQKEQLTLLYFTDTDTQSDDSNEDEYSEDFDQLSISNGG